MKRVSWSLLAVSMWSASSAFAQPDADVQALHREIAALELDHALNLTQAQAQSLLPALREQAATVRQNEAKRASQKAALIAALTRKRDELRSKGTVSPETEAVLKELHGGWGGPGQWHAFRDQVHATLTAQQIESAKALAFKGGKHGAAMAEHERGGGGLFRLHRLVSSDTFIALVEVRARR